MPKTATPQQRVQALREELNRHNYLYYIEARPKVRGANRPAADTRCGAIRSGNRGEWI